MATSTQPVEDDFYFDTSVSNIANPKIGVAASPFDQAFEAGLYDADLTKPEGYEVPEIKESKKEIDVAGGSKALVGDVSQSVLLFSEEEKEKERKRLGTAGDPLNIQTGLATRTGLSSDVVDLGAIAGERKISPSGGIDILEDDPITPAREDLGQKELEDLFEPAEQVPQIGPKEIDEGYQVGKKVYDHFTFEDGAITTPPSSTNNIGQYAGSGVNLANYTTSFSTGLDTVASQASIGLSAAPAASLAGQAAQPTSEAASTWGQFGSDALKVGGKLLQIYGIKAAFDSGTAEGKVSGTLQTAALINPVTAPYVMAYEAIKLLTGWGGIGKWFKGGGYKHPMGGVEFRLGTEAGISDDSDNSKFKYPNADDYDQLIADDSLRIVAPYSWGYNGFPHPEVKKQAQKQIDYLYAFSDKYNVDINEDVFIKAATGTGGFEKHKPSGDRQVSVLERIDNIENGSTTANQWLREVMEYTGPNGERIVSGNPMSQQIDEQSGLYKSFASQEEFELDVQKFSQEFYS